MCKNFYILFGDYMLLNIYRVELYSWIIPNEHNPINALYLLLLNVKHSTDCRFDLYIRLKVLEMDMENIGYLTFKDNCPDSDIYFWYFQLFLFILKIDICWKSFPFYSITTNSSNEVATFICVIGCLKVDDYSYDRILIGGNILGPGRKLLN